MAQMFLPDLDIRALRRDGTESFDATETAYWVIWWVSQGRPLDERRFGSYEEGSQARYEYIKQHNIMY